MPALIDVLIVIHRNYALVDSQINHWSNYYGDAVRLLFCDTSPAQSREGRVQRGWRDEPNFYTIDTCGIDGETHGAGIDFLLRKATTPIVCVNDSDFFWLDPDILTTVLDKMVCGDFVALGAGGGTHADWKRLDSLHPYRQSYMAPVCWGMFIWREIALMDTWVVTSVEGVRIIETGWRVRERLIGGYKTITLPCFYYPEDDTCAYDDPCYFGDPARPTAFHYMRGSSLRLHAGLDHMNNLIAKGIAKWK